MSCMLYPFNYVFRSNVVFYDLFISMPIPIMSHTGPECFTGVVVNFYVSKGPKTLTVKTLA